MRYAFTLLAILLSYQGTALAVPELPATMVLAGSVESDSLFSVRPRPGDMVLAFAQADGQFIAGSRLAMNGDYLLRLTRFASFNGMPIVLELQQGRKRYALTQANGSPAVMKFAGRTLPERTALFMRIGTQTAELDEAASANPEAQRLTNRPDLPCDSLADVNEDGRCDDLDWAILRLYAGGATRTVADP